MDPLGCKGISFSFRSTQREGLRQGHQGLMFLPEPFDGDRWMRMKRVH